MSLEPLRPGARVAVLGVSGPTSPGMLERALAELTTWGVEPIPYASASAAHPWASYLAGTDAVRAQDFQAAWCDPAIDAVVAIRGGYGSVRTLDLLDLEAMRTARPKPFFGSSDTTALQELLRERLGAPSWFTPMPGVQSHLEDPVAMAGLRAAMFEPWRDRVITGAAAETMVGGQAEGTLIGGNLSLLAMTLGARSRPPFDNRGAIALLEDINEDAYRLDGFLTTLLRAGWFDGVAGIALGSWLGCEAADVRALSEELLAPLGVPMVWELGFGHCLGATSVPLGVRAVLDADACSLTLRG